ncbi:MAG: helix-turn-helix domain-containing protein [bacterium]
MKQEQIGQPKRLSYKIREAAQLVGVSEISIRRAIEKGQLRACRAFRHLLIPASELEKLIGGSVSK